MIPRRRCLVESIVCMILIGAIMSLIVFLYTYETKEVGCTAKDFKLYLQTKEGKPYKLDNQGCSVTCKNNILCHSQPTCKDATFYEKGKCSCNRRCFPG